MIRHVISAVLLFLWIHSPAGDLKRISKRIEKGDYEKAVEIIQETLRENDLNPGVKYLYSNLFLNKDFSNNSLDSARIYLFQARIDFPKIGEKEKEEMVKIPITKDSLDLLYLRISHLSFQRAEEQFTIEGWNQFIGHFPDYDNLQTAVNSRDKLIFNKVLQGMQIERFESFLTNYPKSIFTARAKIKLDSLLVLRNQQTDSKSDVEEFIRENPRSEFIEDALTHLLRLSTISGMPSSYLSFISKYPDYQTTQKAIDFLFHLDKEQGFLLYDQYSFLHSNPDSLSSEIAISETYFFPVFDGSIQLVSFEGNRRQTALLKLNQNFLCKGIHGDFLAGETAVGSSIYSISGNLISQSQLINDLGMGFLLIQEGDRKSIVHKSGATLFDKANAAEILAGRFLNVKTEHWGLYSLMGEEFLPPIYDEIFIDGDFWFIRKGDLLALTSPEEIVNSFGKGLALEFKFEEYEFVNSKTIIGFKGNRECLLSSNGEFLVPWGEHQIFPDESKGYVKSSDGYYFIGRPSESYDFITSNHELVAYRKDSLWQLEVKRTGWKTSSRDTIKLLGNALAIIESEIPKIIFRNGSLKELDANDQPTISASHGDHLFITNGKVTTLFNSDGEQIITGNFDEISFLNDSLLAVTFRDKTGLYGLSGRELITIDYDQLALQGEIVSVLKKGKIGAFDLLSSQLIKPDYQGRISRIGTYYLTKKTDRYGLIDSEQNEIIPFEYDAIMDWNDTLVWTKKSAMFHLLNLNDLVPERSVTLLSDFPIRTEKVKKFYGDRGFGLIGNKSGILLQPNFTDIRLIGTEENQIIIGEQNLQQAGYTVLTYFDARGNKIHSQAYRSEEYERVFCDD